MKSLLELHLSVLENLGRHCSIDITRDRKTTTRRCEDEGDSYLTITLPKLAKALERGLDEGHWPERGELSLWKFHRGLPAYMRGFLLRVFDVDGKILDEPDPDCIWAVRQFCLLSQKIERECSPERTQAAFDQFVETDIQLIGLPGRIDPARLQQFVAASNQLFGDLFAHCDRLIAEFGLIPGHGPGAVAEKLSQKEKRNFAYWTDRLEAVFPYWRYTQNTGYRAPVTVDPSNELPVRVVSVRKTQATPRIIAIEPSAMQYAQQGLKRELYERLCRGPLDKVLGFRDQVRNQEMAKVASISGDYATLDLSEASDRVHWFLIYKMVERYPHLWDLIHASRSFRANVPGKGIIPLQKFASMGSALTFPFEAMVFTTLAALGMKERGDIRRISPRRLVGRISVYGDDIIVPVHTVDAVIDWLEHFGAKVNQHKSFWNGKFRESCGAEYYDGHDVTVVRARAELPSSQRDATEIAAYIDLRNRMFMSGLWGVVRDIDRDLENLLSIPYVYVTHGTEAGFLHLLTAERPRVCKTRYNENYQHYEVRVPVLKPLAREYRVDGEAGLLEWFHGALRRGDLVDRYDSQERASSFNIQRRWAPSYLLGGVSD